MGARPHRLQSGMRAVSWLRRRRSGRAGRSSRWRRCGRQSLAWTLFREGARGRCRRAAGVAGRLRRRAERARNELYLESAIQMESLQRAAGQPGVPLVSAGETAGSCGCSCTATTTLVGRMSRHVRRQAAQRGCSLVSDVRLQAAGHGHRLCGIPRASRVVGCTAGAAFSDRRSAGALPTACLRPVAAADTFMQCRYRPDVLAQLGAHGVKPKPSTSRTSSETS